MGLVLADDLLGRGLQRIQGEVDELFDTKSTLIFMFYPQLSDYC